MELIDPRGMAASVMQAAHEAADGWSATNYEDRLTVESAHVLVAADAHIPKHDARLIQEMLERAYTEGVDTILWAGDLLDMEEFSSFGIDDYSSSFQRNARIAGAVLHGVAKMGFKQVYTSGNHEDRLARVVKNHLNLEQVALMCGVQDLMASGQLIVSDNPAVYLPIGNWMVVHPAQYGSFPTVVAGQLATRHQCNVIAAHEHHWGMSTDQTGQFIAISSGGLYDPAKHRYIQHRVTSHRAWQRGYVILHQGHPFMHRGEPTHLLANMPGKER